MQLVAIASFICVDTYLSLNIFLQYYSLLAQGKPRSVAPNNVRRPQCSFKIGALCLYTRTTLPKFLNRPLHGLGRKLLHNKNNEHIICKINLNLTQIYDISAIILLMLLTVSTTIFLDSKIIDFK